jgi:transcriptional regulator GlxA family with amidase domain
MSASKNSAVSEDPVDVLVVLHDKFDLLDFAGVTKVLDAALHDKTDASKSSPPSPYSYHPTETDRLVPAATKAFEVTTAAAEPKVLSQQGVIIGTQMSFKEAYDRLDEFDVLVVLGGNSEAVLKEKAEPLKIIKSFSDLQMKDISRERTLLSVDTGSLFLAELGVLSGLAATTHPDYMTAFENLCSHSAVRDGTDRTDVDEIARYVVNNLRFDLGDEDENPYIRRKSDATAGTVSANGRYVY